MSTSAVRPASPAPSRTRIPERAFQMMLHVRSYEVGRAGGVRPATILRYFEDLATMDSAHRGFDHRWYEDHGSAWVVREMRLLLGPQPEMGATLEMATWLSGFRRVQAHREYALWHAHTQRLVARAQGRWAYIDRATGQPRRIPDDMLARFGAMGCAMPLPARPSLDSSPFPVAVADAARTSELRLVARTYEADTQQHINNCMYADWLEEALAAALDAASETPPVPRLVSRLVSRLVPRAYTLEYIRPVLPGESVRITTQLASVGTRALVGTQTVTRDADQRMALRARTELLTLPPTWPGRQA
jgi:acyl-CoA thioesterase FadM